MEIDLQKYQEFVLAVTSQPSKELEQFKSRANELASGTPVNVPLMLTAAMGLSSESGEFMEIVKKCMWQGKPLNDETIFHIKRELGDIIFYWIDACTAFGFNPNDVITENVNKLKSRYPGGVFDPYYSENRKEGDL